MRNTFKRYAASVIALLMTASICAGCGNTSADETSRAGTVTGTATTTDDETTTNEDSEAQDTSSPEAVVSYYDSHTFTAEINEEVNVSDFVEAAVSASGGEIRVTDNGITLPTGVEYSNIKLFPNGESTKTYTELGTFTENIEFDLKNTSGANIPGTRASVQVKVVDTTAPEIIGAHDWVIANIAEEANFLDGVSAEDNSKERIDVKVDASEVEFGEAGTYTVTYTAKDSSNNEATKSVKVVIEGEETTTTTTTTRRETEAEPDNDNRDPEPARTEPARTEPARTEPPRTSPPTTTTTPEPTTTTEPPIVTEPPRTGGWEPQDTTPAFDPWHQLYGDPLGWGYEYWYWWNEVTGEIVVGAGHP